MKNNIKDRLLFVIKSLKGKIKECDFDVEKYKFDNETSLHIDKLNKSWKNVCLKYKNHFDSKQDYELDLKFFMFEINTLEVKYILKYLYGAAIDYEIIFDLVVNSPKSNQDISIYIINNLKYNLI